MKLLKSVFLLIALLALTQAVQAQNNSTFSLDRTKPIRELDTVRFDPQPYTKMDRKLELYNHISSFGHIGVFVGLGKI